MAERTLLNSGLSAHRPRHYRRDDVTSVDVADVPASQDTAADASGDAETSWDETVPDGLTTKADILEWVDGNPDRAEAALEWENEKPEEHRRKTLVSELTELILEG